MGRQKLRNIFRQTYVIILMAQSFASTKQLVLITITKHTYLTHLFAFLLIVYTYSVLTVWEISIQVEPLIEHHATKVHRPPTVK